jgi:lipid-binding SYLF domain-containing protein
MNNEIRRWFGRVVVMSLVGVTVSGCATSRTAGVNTAINHIGAMERIANNHDLYRLSDYEGAALLSLGKAGAVGFGAMGWSASVYVKDPVKKEFGPPSFVNAGGVSAGLAYAGLNVVDWLLLFKHRDDAVNFAKRTAHANFSNEASFLVWGRKQMTVPCANSFSDGAGLALGAIELELLFGGPRESLHENMYQTGATVDKILQGEVVIPEELKAGLVKLNLLMKR